MDFTSLIHKDFTFHNLYPFYSIIFAVTSSAFKIAFIITSFSAIVAFGIEPFDYIILPHYQEFSNFEN